MAERLKPCPFCGTKAKIAKTHVRFKKGKTKKIKKTAYAIGCSDPECILYNSGTFSSLYFTVSADSLEYMKKNGTGEEYNYGDGVIAKKKYMEKINYLKLK